MLVMVVVEHYRMRQHDQALMGKTQLTLGSPSEASSVAECGVNEGWAAV